MSDPEVFDARAAAETAAAEYPPFRFIAMDDKTYELPNPFVMTPAELREKLGIGADEGPDDIDLDKIDTDEVMAGIAPEAWQAVQELPIAVQRMTMEAWRTHVGVTPDGQLVDAEGKSPSRSSTKKRPAKRSKRTSRSGG